MTEILKLTPKIAYQKILDGAVFIDILEEDGFSVLAYDTEDSLELTLLELLEKMPEMDQSMAYVTGGYDEESGFKAANLLTKNGFANTGYIEGGLRSWYEDGLPVKYNVTGSCGSHDEESGSGGCGGCSCGCG